MRATAAGSPLENREGTCRWWLTTACLPIQLSFTAALDQLRAGYALRSCSEGAVLEALGVVLRKALGQRRVGNRPDRVEPRRLKRRPKDCKWLTKTRQQARADLQAGQKEPKTK